MVDRLGHKIPSIAARINKITTAFRRYPHLTLLQHSRLLAISIVRNLAGVLALGMAPALVLLCGWLSLLIPGRQPWTALLSLIFLLPAVGLPAVVIMVRLWRSTGEGRAALALGLCALAAAVYLLDRRLAKRGVRL